LRYLNQVSSQEIDKSEVPFDLVDAFNMMCWDLKSFDYGHYDIKNNKPVFDNKVTVQQKSVFLRTENFE